MPTKEWKINQWKLDKIQFWLARTTEPFDDWEYDGNELIIFLNEEPIEVYDKETIEEYIFNE
jgi:hypothetical protein